MDYDWVKFYHTKHQINDWYTKQKAVITKLKYNHKNIIQKFLRKRGRKVERNTAFFICRQHDCAENFMGSTKKASRTISAYSMLQCKY